MRPGVNAITRTHASVTHSTDGEGLIGALIVRGSQGNLLDVICALDTSSSLTRRLNRRKQKRDEYRNNGDHNKQLDQREATPSSRETPTLTHIATLHGQKRK